MASTRRIPKFDLAAVVAELEALEERSHDDDVTVEAPAPSEQPELGSPLGDDDEAAPATSRMPKVEEQALIHWELELSRSGMREISRVLPPLVTARASSPSGEEESATKHLVIGLWSLAIAMTATLGYLMATAQ